MMIDKLLDHLVSEKMDMKEYMELAEMTDDTQLKELLTQLILMLWNKKMLKLQNKDNY